MRDATQGSVVRSFLTSQRAPVQVEMLDSSHTSRLETEKFIHDVFFQYYGADIRHFMPELLTLRTSDGQLTAALGVRSADGRGLFLEQYLDEPVEVCLNQRLPMFDGKIKREQVIEVGNLAAASAGGSRWLIIALTAYLQGAGYDWVVFTALPGLRNAFAKMGLKVITLGEAKLSSLDSDEQKLWGNYYDDNPQVVTVNVHHAYGVLEQQLRFEQNLKLLQLMWQQAYLIGSTRSAAFRNHERSRNASRK
jgi:hypothetical protein